MGQMEKNSPRFFPARVSQGSKNSSTKRPTKGTMASRSASFLLFIFLCVCTPLVHAATSDELVAQAASYYRSLGMNPPLSSQFPVLPVLPLRVAFVFVGPINDLGYVTK